MNFKPCLLIAVVGLASPACGGPETIDPGPTQSVAYYFSGINEEFHVHVHWVQDGHKLTQLSPCIPEDDCDIYALSASAIQKLGLTQPPFVVNFASGSGTFTDPGITFTVTTTNGKTFSFTGTVVTSGENVQMQGMFSGVNVAHPATPLVFDRQR